jgi:hypothetical protein
LLFFLLPALDDECVASQRDLDILFGHAGQFGAQLEGFLILGDVDGGERDAERGVRAEPWERQHAEATGEPVE